MLKEMEIEVGRFCFDMFRNPFMGRLLVLAGNNGTGKTHCAKAVSRWVAHVGYSKQHMLGSTVRYLDQDYRHWPTLLDEFKNGLWEAVDDMLSATLTIIDEVGGGHDPSHVGVDKLCQVLSRRERMWTLVTTNATPSSWEDVFDRRVASRLFRNSTLIDLSGVLDFGKL